jgi:preprotein translocase subunit SecY
MAGIVASLPRTLAQLFEGGRTGTIDPLTVAAVIALAVALVMFICFVERAQRRVLIQYPKRQTARGAMQQERSHLPLKVNISGVIPPIFASSLLLMPLTVIQMSGAQNNPDSSDWLITISSWLAHGQPLYLTLYGVGIAFFCFFYSAVQFNSEETAENLKRHGGFIPGIRPGKATETYFDYLGGTSLLIVVNVTMDTVAQIQSHLVAHQYGDLIKKAKLKTGRRR